MRLVRSAKGGDMRFLVLILSCVLLINCSPESTKHIKETIVLEEIVYQRTEGLIILDKLLDHWDTDITNMLVEKIKNFYAYSQPELVGLCTNRNLNITMATYEGIKQDIEKLIQQTSSYGDFLLEKLLSNLNQQKSFYLQVLQDEDLTDLHYYTLNSYLQVVCFMDDMKYLLQNKYAVNNDTLHQTDLK